MQQLVGEIVGYGMAASKPVVVDFFGNINNLEVSCENRSLDGGDGVYLDEPDAEASLEAIRKTLRDLGGERTLFHKACQRIAELCVILSDDHKALFSLDAQNVLYVNIQDGVIAKSLAPATDFKSAQKIVKVLENVGKV